MFPYNTITKVIEISGIATNIFDSSVTPKTILGVQIMQSNTASNTVLKCGNTDIVKNYALSTPQMLLNYVCNDTLSIVKSGQDSSLSVINYVNYDNTISNRDFSAGNMVISFFLLIILVLFIIMLVIKGSLRVSSYKKYTGVNQPEGKEEYNI